MKGNDIGIDLGTTSIIICTRGEQVLLNEPSILAIDTRTDKVLAVGEQAYKMVGRTPAYINAVRPLKDGVVSNHIFTQELIKSFLNRVYNGKLVKPRVAVCIPSSITGIEKDAVVEAVMLAGARQVFLVDEPLAAAIGSGVDITKPQGRMVIDIGGGTTDIAVLSLGGKVVSNSVKIAGNAFDDEIIKYMRLNHHLAIGEKTAEQLKCTVASCYNTADYFAAMQVKGRSLLTGMPIQVEVNTANLLPAVEALASQIAVAAHSVLESTPPELAADLYTNGVLLTGGGSQLKGLAEYLTSRLHIHVQNVSNPVNVVAMGTSQAIYMQALLETGFVDATPKNYFMQK